MARRGGSKSRHAQLREDFRQLAAEYFEVISDPGGRDRDWYARRLAKVAVKLHLFEESLRAGKRLHG